MEDDLDRLERLGRLRADGTLTDAEFQEQKQRLLAGPTPPLPLPPGIPAPPPPGGAPWPWIAGGTVLLALAFAAAILLRYAMVVAPPTTNVADAATNVAEPFPTPVPSATVRPAVTVGGKLLLVDGRPADPPIRGNTRLDVIRTLTVADHDLYVVQDTGGTACPATFYIADASTAGVHVSDAFGTCSDRVRIAETPDGLTVSLPGFMGPSEPAETRAAAARERHVFRYAAGQVRETVTRPALPVSPPPVAQDDEDAPASDQGSGKN